MLKYNICFVKRGNEILLLNRERSSWMGCWNGIGGKLDSQETPREAMIREMVEETGIEEYDLHFKGLVTWSGDDFDFGGMYAYVAEVPENIEYATPKKMDEGILDWKKLEWIMDSNNVGIVSNIRLTLPYMLKEKGCYDHHCRYENGVLMEVLHKEISVDLEMISERREQYLRSYTVKQEVSSKLK
ncbi:DNA mismatch repair protein MutT [Paenibacillus sp. FSL H8-0548]|uniref:NUDIX hydrolase n=1 Tax=Paenibacillus sp. FSL H8-0548 TaxID=1920422 RepID=UPI00096D1BA4|nr:8-oxo-dGTP diphosphatase [Paenibacillus sp. FSL H8-0548]OMF21461.1 DNA mismatch repair protein MutT [Paenibacillus sp. FSL H8-0548]